MKPLSREAGALLARYREEHALPEAARARARGALAQRVAAGAADGAPDVAWPPSPPRGLRWIWFSAGTASLLGLSALWAVRSPPPAPRDDLTARSSATRLDVPSTTAPAPSEGTGATAAMSVATQSGRAVSGRAVQPPGVRAASSSSARKRRPPAASSSAQPSLDAPSSARSLLPPVADPARHAPPLPADTSSAHTNTPVSATAPPASDVAHVGHATPAPDPLRSAPDQPHKESLDVEVQLLRSAHDRLGAAQPLNALSILSEHARRFPNGQLRDMREVSRVIALCDLGRVAEARERAQRFLQQQPRSHYAARLHESCAAKRE